MPVPLAARSKACGSAAARLLGLWVRISPGTWVFVCCECCVLSGRGLCYGLITRPEESYRLWCVVVCDLEKPQEWGGHSPRLGCKRHKKVGGYGILLIPLLMFSERTYTFHLQLKLPIFLCKAEVQLMCGCYIHAGSDDTRKAFRSRCENGSVSSA